MSELIPPTSSDMEALLSVLAKISIAIEAAVGRLEVLCISSSSNVASAERSTSKEPLDIRGFAQRLGKSEGTIRNWMKTGVLERGHHFNKIKNNLTFYWTPELTKEIQANYDRIAAAIKPKSKPRPSAPGDRVNWDN